MRAPRLAQDKRIVLGRDGSGAWKIAVETPIADRRCGLSALRADPPRLWTLLRDEHVGLVAVCECDREDCPGLGGSIGCDPSSARSTRKSSALPGQSPNATRARPR